MEIINQDFPMEQKDLVGSRAMIPLTDLHKVDRLSKIGVEDLMVEEYGF